MGADDPTGTDQRWPATLPIRGGIRPAGKSHFEQIGRPIIVGSREAEFRILSNSSLIRCGLTAVAIFLLHLIPNIGARETEILRPEASEEKALRHAWSKARWAAEITAVSWFGWGNI